VRLLLLERMTPHGALGERRATVTGLRKGAQADGTVAQDALDRLDACLAGYAEAIADAGWPPVVAVGTAAVREAPNRDEIAAVVHRRLNTDLVVVTGEQEAALAYRGARMALADPDGPFRMIDIGGASTEIVAGDASGPHHVVSLPLGVVRNAGDTVEGARLEALRRVADATTIFPADGPVIGLAGTVTQAAALCNGRYDPDEIHRQQLGRDSIERVLAEHPAIADVAVIGVPDERWGEVPRAVVVLKAGAALDPHDLVAWCRERLAAYKVPKAADIVAELPRNPTGKILKRELRKPYWAGRDRQVV
jgi:exopolyphosphatase/pppGpp-phosphohydrolase